MLTPGLDQLASDAFLAGFGICEIAMATVFAALVGLVVLRKLLTAIGW